MKVVALALVVVCTGFGVRSIVYWGSRPFDSEDVVDHLLYGLYVTGRAGLWFAFAGLFGIYAFAEIRGHALVDVTAFRWYVLVFVGLGLMQLLAGWFLGRRGTGGAGE